MNSSYARTEKILVVEDEPGITQVCRRVLISEGYQVDIATNGLIAEDMLAEEDYDLLLIDIRTPIMNGKEFYQNIKDRYPRLVDRIVFTTGDVISGDIQYFLEQTGRPSLLKPFTPDELRAVAKETLERLQ